MIYEYSRKLPTVEIDATWYRLPDRRTVEAWKSKTPEGFIFSAKVPRVITHEKYLEHCESELNEFLSVMSILGEKLGPLLLQFPYFAKGRNPMEYETGNDFVARLRRFSDWLPKEFRWVVEIRNTKWVRASLLDVLRERGISLAFIDYYTMDPLYKLAQRPEVFTAPFVYVRFLGNRKNMEVILEDAKKKGQRKRDWESLLVDRARQMKPWIPPLMDLTGKKVPTYVYFNNHYAGYAPGSVELFGRLLNESMTAPNRAPSKA